MRFHLQFEILSDFEYLPFLTRIFRGFKAPKASILTQILVEAYNNAVIHGHQKKKEKWVSLAIDVAPMRTKMEVVDRGRGLGSGQGMQSRGPMRTTGRGLQIINALSDRVVSKRKKGLHILEITRFY